MVQPTAYNYVGSFILICNVDLALLNVDNSTSQELPSHMTRGNYCGKLISICIVR